jgi:hypothetical protein
MSLYAMFSSWVKNRVRILNFLGKDDQALSEGGELGAATTSLQGFFASEQSVRVLSNRE